MNETPTTVASALTLSGITKTYPGVTALDAVSVDIAAGRVHAVLGENGAGKSTLVGIAAGSVVPDAGTIGLAGREFDRIRPAEAREAGLAIVYQIPALAPSLSVVDAVPSAAPASKRPSRRTAAAWVTAHFERLSLKIDPHALVSSLSLREAHLVEIAAAWHPTPVCWCSTNRPRRSGRRRPRGCSPRSGAAREGRRDRLHHPPDPRGDGDRRRPHRAARRPRRRARPGRGLHRGSGGRAHRRAVARDDVPRQARAPAATATPALEVLELSGPGYDNVSFSVYPGQIIGLAGVEGNGQRRVLRGIAGGGATAAGSS